MHMVSEKDACLLDEDEQARQEKDSAFRGHRQDSAVDWQTYVVQDER